MAWAFPESTATSDMSTGRNFINGKDPAARAGKSADASHAFTGPPDIRDDGSFTQRVMEVVLGQVGRDHHATGDHCSNNGSHGVCKMMAARPGLGEIEVTNPEAPSCCLASKVRVPGVTGGDFT